MDVKDENVQADEATTTSDDVETKQEPTVDELKAEIERLQRNNKQIIDSRDAAKQKLRDLESDRERTALEKKADYEAALQLEREKYNSLQTQLREQAVGSALLQALSKTNVLAVDTALQLIDRSAIVFEDGQVDESTVADAIKTLQEKHNVLFGEPTKPAPTPKKAGEETPTGGYVEELKRLQQNPNATRRDLDQLRQKYGRN